MEPLHLFRAAPVARRSQEASPIRARAFTLIELLVVVAIIVTVTTIALSSQSNFNKSLVLANTAYDIALTIRSAEVFGMGGRVVSGTPNAGYGIHLQTGAPDFFKLFADTWPPPASACTRPDCKPGDRLFSEADTVVQTYTLGNSITISDFCVYSDRPRCASVGEVTSLDIVFSRPNAEAFISANGSSYGTYTAACLSLTARDTAYRYVTVTSAGEILADSAACP